MECDHLSNAGADPEFHAGGGSNSQRGFDLFILPYYSLFFLIFMKFLHENEIILSQRGVRPL